MDTVMSTKQQGNKVLSVEVKPIHNILATIILNHEAHGWTPKECIRYFTRSLLKRYRINGKTSVSIEDWQIALPIAKEKYIEEYRSSVGIDKRKYCPPERSTSLNPPLVSTRND